MMKQLVSHHTSSSVTSCPWLQDVRQHFCVSVLIMLTPQPYFYVPLGARFSLSLSLSPLFHLATPCLQSCLCAQYAHSVLQQVLVTFQSGVSFSSRAANCDLHDLFSFVCLFFFTQEKSKTTALRLLSTPTLIHAPLFDAHQSLPGSLFSPMAISLGRTIGAPLFVLLQVVNMSSGFFFILGFVCLGMELYFPSLRMARQEANTTANGSPAVELGNCFHISLKSLFVQPTPINSKDLRTTTSSVGGNQTVVSGSHAHFFAMHTLTALFMAPFLALLVGRRKLVPDFVLSLYGLYLLLTDMVTRRVLGGDRYWWGITLCGAAVLYLVTWAICRHRELQDISLGGSTPQPQPVTSTRPAAASMEYELESRNATQRRDAASRVANADTGTVAVEISARPPKAKVG